MVSMAQFLCALPKADMKLAPINVLAQLQLFFSHLCDNLADSLRSFGPALQYDQLKLIYIFQISNLLKFLKAGLNLLNLDTIVLFMASISMSSEVGYLQDSPPHCKYWIQLGESSLTIHIWCHC